MLKRALYCSFLAGMVQYPLVINAQKKLEKNITVPGSTIRVDALFDLFSKEADLEFSINSKRINLAQMIHVTHHSQTVTGWLSDLSSATGISYKIKGDHVILEDQKTATLPVTTNHISTSLSSSSEKPKDSDPAIAASDNEEKNIQKDKEEEEKLKEGLIILIREDLHTVYTPKKTLDHSIHPANTEKAIVFDSTKPTPSLQGLIKVDLGPAGIMVGTERRMGSKMTIDLSAGIGGGYDVWDYKLNYTLTGDPEIVVSINPRFYFNRDKRSVTRLNAGNYIGLRIKLNVPPIEPGTSTEAFMANPLGYSTTHCQKVVI